MKLMNVHFIRPIFMAGKSVEGVSPSEGYVEELPTFPWCRVHVNGKTRRTTMFNIASCDDWEDDIVPMSKRVK